MKKVLPILCLAALFASCQRTTIGEGQVTADTREVGKFTSVALNMNALVLVKDSLEHSCTVKAQKNLHEVIITRLDGNTLVITTKGQVLSDEPVIIELSLNKEQAFEVNGSGQIRTVNTLKNDELDFEINGSGVVDADVVANSITSNISGSGVLNLRGSANRYNAQISGSGSVNAFQLPVLNSKASVSGSGEAHLNVGETLYAKVSGSGSVRYKGSPSVEKSISGSGTVEPAP